MNFKIEQIKYDKDSIKQYADFLVEVFQKPSLFTPEYIDWIYNQNPDGKTIGFNAFTQDGQLVAHYAAQPLQAMLYEKLTKGILSFNSATHPDYGRKGIFTKLAQATYDLAKSQGYEFVMGVGNQKSTQVRIKKLNFQLVTPLDVKVGVGNIKYGENPVYDYQRYWSAESVEWRLNHPAKNYYVKKNKARYEVLIQAKPGLNVVLGDFADSYDSLQKRKSIAGLAKMWIGVDPQISWKKGIFVNLPNKLKPAPLNLIFRDLTNPGRLLDKSKIKFNVFDFDAF